MTSAWIGLVAIGLTFVGYIPYSRDITLGKTKPHIYSWFIWALVTFIVFGLQMSGGAGLGGMVTLSAALLCIWVIFLGKKYGSTSTIRPIDTVFLGLAILTVGLWLVAKQSLLSVVLATIIDILGFVPTVRKSWHEPYSETLLFYWMNTLRFGLATLALNRFSVITALYPISWMVINFLFGMMLVARRTAEPRIP
jgi:hypothetical protein